MATRNRLWLVVLFSTTFATAAHAKVGERTNQPVERIQPVEASASAVLCVSEGAWCDPFNFKRIVRPVVRHTELRGNDTWLRTASATAQKALIKVEVDSPDTAKVKLEPVSPNALFCWNDKRGCRFSPTTRSDRGATAL